MWESHGRRKKESKVGYQVNCSWQCNGVSVIDHAHLFFCKCLCSYASINFLTLLTHKVSPTFVSSQFPLESLWPWLNTMLPSRTIAIIFIGKWKGKGFEKKKKKYPTMKPKPDGTDHCSVSQLISLKWIKALLPPCS